MSVDKAPEPVTVSIIICTRNRAGHLKSTLESINSTSVPDGWKVELIVVDNGSIDHTRAIVVASPVRKIQLRYEYEPSPGQCHARNTGLRQSTGEVILFTDDDVRVHSGWLVGMCEPILANRFDAVTGGIVFPPHIAFALSRPPFSSRRSWFASSEYLDPAAPACMIGANMAFHRRVLGRVPFFDVELGPGTLGFQDDTLFCLQLQEAGYRLGAALETAVEHHFDTSRLDRRSMLEIAAKIGRSTAFLHYHWEHRHVRFLALRRACWSALRPLIRWRDQLPRYASMPVTSAALRVEQELGYCLEFRRQSHRPRKYSRSSAASAAA